MKIAAGVFAGGGIGLFTLANAFKTKHPSNAEPYKLDYNPTDNPWKYVYLDPGITSELAYNHYVEGGCMYATCKSIITQLAEKIGEPYASFPYHMFKYGHGGIGGFGSVCGAVNGAAALVGLLIADKNLKDRTITDVFQWYEQAPLPMFNPVKPALDYTPDKSVANSVLCHASNTNWCSQSGYKVKSKERKERCRRLTADVSQKVTTVLNEVMTGQYMTNVHGDESVNACLSCHGSEGKMENVSVKMSCTSCHAESVGHQVFSDIHYKVMKE